MHLSANLDMTRSSVTSDLLEISVGLHEGSSGDVMLNDADDVQNPLKDDGGHVECDHDTNP